MAAHNPLMAWLTHSQGNEKGFLKLLFNSWVHYYIYKKIKNKNLWVHEKYYSIRLNSLAWGEQDRVLNNH